jgi:hypothetical protein
MSIEGVYGFQPEYALDTFTYLKVSPRTRGLICGHVFRPNGVFQYIITWPDREETYHYEHELQPDKDLT